MNKSKIYLEKFINDYIDLYIDNLDCKLDNYKNNNMYQILDNLYCKLDYNKYFKFIDKYGFIDNNRNNYKEINFFKKNLDNLLQLTKDNSDRLWLFENLSNISMILSQIQTDMPFPEQGFYIYKNFEFKNGISAPAYLLFFINKINDSYICKFGENCYNCNPVHLSKFFHPQTNSTLCQPSNHSTLKNNDTRKRIRDTDDGYTGHRNTRRGGNKIIKQKKLKKTKKNKKTKKIKKLKKQKKLKKSKKKFLN